MTYDNTTGFLPLFRRHMFEKPQGSEIDTQAFLELKRSANLSRVNQNKISTSDIFDSDGFEFQGNHFQVIN